MADVQMYTYYLIACAECGMSHDAHVVAEDEGQAWHEVIRSCSPEDSELVDVRPATREEERWAR